MNVCNSSICWTHKNKETLIRKTSSYTESGSVWEEVTIPYEISRNPNSVSCILLLLLQNQMNPTYHASLQVDSMLLHSQHLSWTDSPSPSTLLSPSSLSNLVAINHSQYHFKPLSMELDSTFQLYDWLHPSLIVHLMWFYLSF